MSEGAESSELEVSERSTASAMPEAEAREGYKWIQLGPKSIEIPVEWAVMPLGDLTEVVSGGTPSTKNPNYWKGKHVWVTPTDITELSGKYISDSEKKITDEGLKNSSATLLQPGAVLMTSRATIGESAINTIPAATNQGFKSFLCGERLHNEYLYYYLPRAKSYLNAIGGGSTFSEVNKGDVSSLRIPLPSTGEQRRIAEVLSTVDEQIQQTEQTIETAVELKRGLMQDLLIRGFGHDEYEQIYLGPRELTIPAEWERVRVRDVAELITRGKQPTYVEEPGVPVLNQSCIYWDGFHPEELRYLDEDVADGWKGKYFVDEGDVLINSTGRGTLGRALHWSGPSDEYALDGHITRVKTKRDEIDPRYLRYYLESTHGQTMLHAFCVAGSTGQTELSKADLLTMPLLKPPIEEQRHIADALTQVTRKIRDEQEHNDELQELKRGLMQDLLTGTVRVPESIEAED